MKKGRKRKISVVNTTSNTLVATFGSEGDTKSFPNFSTTNKKGFEMNPKPKQGKKSAQGTRVQGTTRRSEVAFLERPDGEETTAGNPVQQSPNVPVSYTHLTLPTKRIV